MSYFPTWLRPTNGHLFQEYKIKELEKILSKEIINHLISRENEDEYFDLFIFRSSLPFIVTVNELNIALENIKKELCNNGWNVKTSFGDTGLFIYSTEDPPKSCW